MILKFLALSLVVSSSLATSQDAKPRRPIPMLFSGTEVAQALKAIGLRTRTGIVYAAGKEKIEISLNATVATPEEAIRAIVSAAGLSYRKVGDLYVVASPAGLRRALEAYAVRASLTPEVGRAADLAPRLQAALPYATVEATGEQISILGVTEDILRAREILQKFESQEVATRATTDVVILRQANAATIAPLVAGLYANVKVTPSTNDKGAGAIALFGPLDAVRLARATTEGLDASMGIDAVVYKVYNLRYTTGPTVTDFLKQAAPNVEAFTGPEAYIPRRALFNPVSATLSSGDSGQGFFGGEGGQGGTQSGFGGGNQGSTGNNQGNDAPYRPGDRAKVVVLKGPATEVDAAIKLISEIDRKPKQVVVEVSVVETSPSNDSDVGLKYDWSAFNFVEVPPGTLVTPTETGYLPFPLNSSPTRPAGVGQFSRVPWNFRATLSAMITKREARILAKPSVTVVDNGQASVFIGDTIRVAIPTAGALGAQNLTTQAFPVGIILLIAPRVNADGNITMHVNPVVSTVTSFDSFGVPSTSAREAETTTIVKSGETVVLGGLIRDSDIKTVQEVPLLARLPIVGELFKHRSRRHQRNEIIVTITPHLIDDETKEVAKG